MKKYIPAKMIHQSRFIAFYDTWNKDEKEQLLERMSKLILDNPEYTDSGNYGHLCNLLTSIAMVMILEENGKSRIDAENAVWTQTNIGFITFLRKVLLKLQLITHVLNLDILNMKKLKPMVLWELP